ncbi:MAG: hypothetical protein MJ099_02720 [Clostridia bacterium]|nr:hypothetical protein [Clostridia bacterium]
MEAVYNVPASEPRIFFAARRSRDYMMRSERRPQGSGYRSPNHRGRRPRRRKAGFFYILLTLLLSLILWPVGMIMLWQRKVRWRVTTKLLTSIISLFLCILLIVFGLTVDTNNDRFTNAQDKVNDFLSNASVHIADGYDVVCDTAVQVYTDGSVVMKNLGSAALSAGAVGIDRAVELTADLRAKIFGEEAPAPTEAPTAEPTDVPTEAPTNAPTDVPTEAPTDTPDEAVTAEPTAEAVTEAPTDVPTEAPTAEPTPEAGFNGFVPAKLPDAESGEAIAAISETVTVEPTEAPTAAPTAEPTATPAPTLDPNLKPKAVSEATVYYHEGGKSYHLVPTCNGMHPAPAHPLSAALDAGKKNCGLCHVTAASIVDEADVLWLDENNTVHMTDECASFVGSWHADTLENIIEAGYTACADCRAAEYMSFSMPEPTPEPTATPAPAVVSPPTALKSAGEATVDHTPDGKWYHTAPTCKGMSGGKPYTLAEVANGYKRCNTCSAPDAALIGVPCLWEDENGLCHTSDDCASFVGQFTLIPRDDALSANLAACPDCGASEYLIPNTLLQGE